MLGGVSVLLDGFDAADALVVPMMIAVQPGFDTDEQLLAIISGVKVDMLVLDRAPEALDVNVIECSAFAVHANADALLLKVANVLGAGKLTPLVGVQNLGWPMVSDGLTHYA